LINKYFLTKNHPAQDFINQQHKQDAEVEKQREEARKKELRELAKKSHYLCSTEHHHQSRQQDLFKQEILFEEGNH